VTQAPPALKPAINPGSGASQIPTVAQPPTLKPVNTLADAYANARAQNLYNVELQPALTSPTNYSMFNTNYLERATSALNVLNAQSYGALVGPYETGVTTYPGGCGC
jgi:hypothetical protein